MGGERLREGFTTGSCAALAAQAATRMLLTHRPRHEAELVTPKGVRLRVPTFDAMIGGDEAACSVVKNAGDDPDVTDGILVRATVRRSGGNGGEVAIDGGDGVGRVTKPGLDQPVGAAAINSVPRRMIEEEVRRVCEEAGYGGGISVVISIPGGEAAAARTFNPRLGIVGGLSVIGTTGVVEPMSTRAIIETARLELKVLRESGADGVILTPGNYGEAFLRECPGIALRAHAVCSNFVGEALDAAAELGFSDVLLVGHFGKFVKLAGGVMDTHSRAADCRMELLALGAALAGAKLPLVRRVLDAVTVDDGLDILGGLRAVVVDALLERAESYCACRIDKGGKDGARAGIVVFSNRFGLLGVSGGAGTILSRWEERGG